MKAWLVTWEWAGDHAAVDEPIASILNPGLSGESVAIHVERLYTDATYSLGERLAVVKNRSANPYPAKFDRVQGVQFSGRITCGHNPFLYARLVSDLAVVKGGDGEERFQWTEPPKPELPVVPR